MCLWAWLLFCLARRKDTFVSETFGGYESIRGWRARGKGVMASKNVVKLKSEEPESFRDSGTPEGKRLLLVCEQLGHAIVPTVR